MGMLNDLVEMLVPSVKQKRLEREAAEKARREQEEEARKQAAIKDHEDKVAIAEKATLESKQRAIDRLGPSEKVDCFAAGGRVLTYTPCVVSRSGSSEYVNQLRSEKFTYTPTAEEMKEAVKKVKTVNGEEALNNMFANFCKLAYDNSLSQTQLNLYIQIADACLESGANPSNTDRSERKSILGACLEASRNKLGGLWFREGNNARFDLLNRMIDAPNFDIKATLPNDYQVGTCVKREIHGILETLHSIDVRASSNTDTEPVTNSRTGVQESRPVYSGQARDIVRNIIGKVIMAGEHDHLFRKASDGTYHYRGYDDINQNPANRKAMYNFMNTLFKQVAMQPRMEAAIEKTEKRARAAEILRQKHADPTRADTARILFKLHKEDPEAALAYRKKMRERSNG